MAMNEQELIKTKLSVGGAGMKCEVSPSPALVISGNGPDYFGAEIRCKICLKLKVNLANYPPSAPPAQHIQIQIHPSLSLPEAGGEWVN